MHKPKHSKFKNTAILFELLTRQITADILAGNDGSEAKQILFKYFSENTELGKEYRLYNLLLSEKSRDSVQADRILNVVVQTRNKLNNKELLKQKYDLIKEIKSVYPIDSFLKGNIKNYRLLASIYKVFETAVSSKSDVAEVIQARESIIESLSNNVSRKINKDEELVEYYKKQNEDVRLLAYKFLLEGLNKKYKEFDENQKKLLREYILNVSNTNSLSKLVCEEVGKVKHELTKLIPGIKDNPVVKIKLSEMVNVLNKIKSTTVVKDNHVVTLLLSYELIKELKNLK